MTDSFMNLKIKCTENKRTGDRIALIQYSLLFCILVIGIYAVLIINHKSFIQNGDGVKQGYFWAVEFKHLLESLFSGRELPFWSWSKFIGLDVQTNNYWDPFNWIAAAFPPGYIELGYTIASVLRMYCGGAAFLLLMRYTGLGVAESVIGSAFYTFSGYCTVIALVHPDGLMNHYLFPLLVYSVERIYKGRSAVPFSLFVALYLISVLYYSYMAAVSIVLFTLLRYFAYREFSIKDYAATIGRFVFFGLTGVLLAGFQLLTDMEELSAASAESATDKGPLLFDRYYYLELGKKLIGTGNTENYQIMGWTLIVIILIVISIRKISLKKTSLIMTLLLLTGYMLPAVCSIYNGFGYPTQRWIFSLGFFAAWTAAEELGNRELFTKKNAMTAAVTLTVMAFLSIGLNYICGFGLGRRALLFMGIQLAGGAVFVTVLALACRNGKIRELGNTLTVLILIGTLTCAWTLSFHENKGAFRRNNSINKALQQSTQRAGAQIEDDSFYRIDQVDSILYRHIVKSPPNETLWWQTRSIYGYNSRIPADIYRFNGMVGNNYGYSKRVSVVSNDNRTGLDYLYGVRYFLGDDVRNDRTGSDEYAGYGFEPYGNIDGVNVFRSRFDVSLGYGFDKYICESDLEKFNPLEREQVLLQAVTVPDDVTPAGTKRADIEELETDVRSIAYTISETDGVSISDHEIRVSEGGGSFTIEPGKAENCQLVLSFTGLMRDPVDGQSRSFVLNAENEYISEIADNTITNQTIPGIKDYYLNFGYYKTYENGKIEVRLSEPGTYVYDSIDIYAMDAAFSDKYISELGKAKYDIESFTDRRVDGTVSLNEPGILFLSIADHENWEIYVDGEKADAIRDLDIAFVGAEVPEGTHRITLVYGNKTLRTGALVSLAGVIVLTCAFAGERRKKRGDKDVKDKDSAI